MDHLLINLLTLVLLWHPAHGSRRETELCYIKGLPINTNVCRTPTNVLCCHEVPTDINVTVYRGANCNSPSQCGPRSEGCCSKSTKINITKEYSNALKLSFISTKCFSEVNSGNIVLSSMPNSTGLDLVVVSFNCPDGGTAAPRVDKEEISSNVAAAVAVPLTIVVVGVVVVLTIFYVRRRRSRKDATEQRQEIHTNNAYTGAVSRSIDLHQNAYPSTKAKDQGTNHYYAEIADNSASTSTIPPQKTTNTNRLNKTKEQRTMDRRQIVTPQTRIRQGRTSTTISVTKTHPETTTTSPTALPPTREMTTTSHTALPPTRDSHETTTIAVSITCSVIIILLAAIVTGICVYRRRVNTGATTQVSDRMPQSNNIYSQEPIAENNDNVVPPTYEQLLRQTNEGEYSQIIGHTAAAQTPEPGTGDPHSGQGRIYVNIEETT